MYFSSMNLQIETPMISSCNSMQIEPQQPSIEDFIGCSIFILKRKIDKAKAQ